MSAKKPTNESVLNYLFTIYKRNAKYRKLEFNLTKEQTDELFQLPCVYCGLEYSMETERRWGSGKFKHNGIDRVDSSRNYDYDNCVPCCKLCNQFKHGRSKEEFLNWVKEVMSYHKSSKTV